MKKSGLLSGALVLTVGGLLAKVFSAIYRIALTCVLGGEGIGIYQLIFPLYSLCVVLATAGLPMAISKVVARNKGSEKIVLKKCLVFTSLISTFLSLILFFGGKGLAELQGQSEIGICYLILAPTIIMLGISSCLRGYFQGVGFFVPSSVSNIVEQFVKMLAGLILSIALLSVGLLASIIGAVVGIVISELVSLVIMIMFYSKRKAKSDVSITISYRDLIKDVLPITLTNIILPISSFVDSVVVVKLLNLNFPQRMSVFLYGLESGAVSSLITLPTVFSFAIASVVLPLITSSSRAWNKNYKLSISLKIILTITVPCVLLFIFVPDRLISLLYGSRLDGLGVSGSRIASGLLALSSIGIVPLALNQLFSSCLQAVNQRYVTIRNLIIAVIFKILVEVMFIPCRMLNIFAFAISNVVCYLTVMLLNFAEIRQHFKLRINYLFGGKLLVCNVAMILTIIYVYAIKYSVFNTVLGGIIACAVYLISIILTNMFGRNEKALLKYRM